MLMPADPDVDEVDDADGVDSAVGSGADTDAIGDDNETIMILMVCW